jgi:large subunit ribosomal protein L21
MDPYAVIETGGKQYRVKKGDVLKVERVGGEVGDKVSLDRVLALSSGSALAVGTPAVAKAAVVAEIIEQLRGEKVIAYKKKRRKGYHRKKGHRQELTKLRVADITGTEA